MSDERLEKIDKRLRKIKVGCNGPEQKRRMVSMLVMPFIRFGAQ